MDTIGTENLANAIPNALMPPEENTVRVTAKGLEMTVDLDDSGGAVFVAKATPAAAAANLTNNHTSRTCLEQPARETEHIQRYHDRGTGRPAADVIATDMEHHDVRATRNNPGHDCGRQ